MAVINDKNVLFSVHLHTGSGGTDDETVLNALAELFDLPVKVEIEVDGGQTQPTTPRG